VNVPEKTESLTEDEFDERYNPQPDPADGNSIWPYAHVEDKATEFVWSVVEVDDDLFVIPGWHVVNVIGYNVTQVPWSHENIEVRLDNPHDEHRSNCKDGSEDCVI